MTQPVISNSGRNVLAKHALYQAAVQQLTAAVLESHGIDEAVERVQQAHLEWMTANILHQQEQLRG